jgi:NADH-quinone oxidoreductase subunit E
MALTTADRRFTVRTVACFGQCALAPVVEVNHHILSHVNERTLQREVKSLTEGGSDAAHSGYWRIQRGA